MRYRPLGYLSAVSMRYRPYGYISAGRAAAPSPKSVGRKHVARAAHSLQVARLLRVHFYLAAQSRDLHVNSAFLHRFAADLVSVQQAHKFSSRQGLCRLMGENAHQRRLGRSKSDGIFTLPQLSTLNIIPHRPKVENLRHRRIFYRGRHPPQDRIDA